jgi:hypothetical protein
MVYIHMYIHIQQAVALAEAQSVSREMKENFMKKNQEFRYIYIYIHIHICTTMHAAFVERREEGIIHENDTEI